MAHQHQLKFVSLADQHFVRHGRETLRILEVGSYDVNGSVRHIFTGSDYIGADLCEGPGVDIVRSGHEIDFADASFDLTISCECFEHNPYWVETFLNMHRMTKPGGLVVITCASRGRLEHGTPRANYYGSPGTSALGMDYYRNLGQDDFARALRLDELFASHRFFYIRKNHDLYFIGWKQGEPRFRGDIERFSRDVRAINRLGTNRIKIFDLPVSLARLLPLDDRSFQNFAFGYLTMVRPVREFIRSLSKRHK
jgi:SAM-dependent methyltransferase